MKIIDSSYLCLTAEVTCPRHSKRYEACTMNTKFTESEVYQSSKFCGLVRDLKV